jgi:glycogen phosphorylase
MRGLELAESSPADHLAALALTVREPLVDRRLHTHNTYRAPKPKTVYYLSMEYMLGRLTRNNLIATGLLDTAQEVLEELGLDLDAILEEEPDPGLGSGGLGRLAACFMESLATLDYPAVGYGLRYDYGIFRQEFRQGWQHERPDTWLKGGHVWAIHRPDRAVSVPIGGRVDVETLANGRLRRRWVPGNEFNGIPHDVLVAGFGTPTVGLLRLWRAEAPSDFDFEMFSKGDFLRAVGARERVEAITKVLYPSDNVDAGRELRFLQEYFLVACAVRDLLSRFRHTHGSEWNELPNQVAIQLNDTHPALAVAELMRVLVDEVGLPWRRAFAITRATCAYTNHTLQPEALESWRVERFQQLLPRHAEIIFEINKRFLEEVRKSYPGDVARVRRMSLVHEDGDRRFRMAHLAIVGCHTVNGVASLHTELLKKHVVRDFAEMWPERFLAITNGITPRRWLAACNPRLADAITARIGKGWERDLDRLAGLRESAGDPAFQRQFRAVKRANKLDLTAEIQRLTGIEVDPDSLFDVQIKRLHEYKRQLLKAMHIIALYRRLKAAPGLDLVPRTFVFGAKAAPDYTMAKLIIKLINSVGEVVNGDPEIGGRLRVVFLPDYRVTLAEKIIPAADLSEQISTAGTEASGTGNMKFALNGAITIGTLDGANVEIRAAVGEENIFIFGLTAEQAHELRGNAYDPSRLYRGDAELAGVLDAIRDGVFTNGDRQVLRDLWGALMERGDYYLHLADFRAYLQAQERVETLFRDEAAWAAMAIRNVAAMGYFSSDRAIREYADKIWHLSPVPIDPQQ